MEKKSEILEYFKTAIGSTVKSLSNSENVEVSFGSQNFQSKNFSQNRDRFEYRCLHFCFDFQNFNGRIDL